MLLLIIIALFAFISELGKEHDNHPSDPQKKDKER